MELVTLIILRSAERLMGVMIGGFLAWLGYRLFLEVPTKSNSSGEFTLPGGSAIHLTRVGPGIFFSLFGTAIVFFSFMKPINFKQELALSKQNASAEGSAGQVMGASYSGALPTASRPSPAKQDMRNVRRKEIELLNRLPDQLRPDLNSTERNEYLSAIPRIKLAVMEPLWDEDWGDLTRFKDWVDKDGENVSPELNKPGTYFKSK
jgi:hypothetical protein